MTDRHRLLGFALAAHLMAALATGGAGDAPEAVPKGEVTKHSFEQSTIFPGTVRDYWVYVPKQYDGTTPACLYVNQDGVQFNAPAVFDRLIAAKEMPVTIGVFVMHGRVPAPNAESLDRFNRSFEYDGLGDAYARFLLDELLPHAIAEQQLAISPAGKDHAIGGTSSGGIAAFTAAWERPDAFTRVFSGVGTYVGLRGGNNYPTLVRKVEPKALRVFLQDGSNDANNFAGDWWMANQEMERALRFAGYEVDHAWGEGPHDGKGATAVFADAMRFLWKGWPEAVPAGAGSKQLQEILQPGEGWQLVGAGYRLSSGAAVDAHGQVSFNDVAAGKAYRIAADGKPELVAAADGSGSGQRFAPDGRLYATVAATQEVVAYHGDGTRTVIAGGIAGNDLAVRHDGGVYVTAAAAATTPGQGSLWYISPAGEKRKLETAVRSASGITLSTDQSLLYVADALSHWVYSYQVEADGSLKDQQRYYWLHVPDGEDDSGAGGMRTDRDGRLYVATRLGIQVCDQPGRVTCIIPTPGGRVTSLSFGGAQLDVLYACCGDKVYRRKLKVQGVEGFQPPIKPAAPHL
jgi:sugar lactone lactonase YvrE/enterochelin esterase-like enzyme